MNPVRLWQQHSRSSCVRFRDWNTRYKGEYVWVADKPDDERTGFAIASFLASRPDLQRSATIMVHSFNADGAMRMVEELRGAGRQADCIPFHFLEERLKNFWPR